VRVELGTNLIGGQPMSLANMREIRRVCDEHGLLLVMDASLLADNLYFIKTREPGYADVSIARIAREIADVADVLYFSARKLGHARGGGMSVREMEAIAVQVEYAIDRITWLHENRELVGGLEFVEEPEVLRFFYGRLAPTSDWQEKLVAKFREDFGDSL